MELRYLWVQRFSETLLDDAPCKFESEDGCDFVDGMDLFGPFGGSVSWVKTRFTDDQAKLRDKTPALSRDA